MRVYIRVSSGRMSRTISSNIGLKIYGQQLPLIY
jgi:hypothetical protein